MWKFCLLVFFPFLSQGVAQETRKERNQKEVSKNIIQEWEKAGAKYSADPMPTFFFATWEKGVLSKLPNPDAPFRLVQNEIGDTGLEELSSFNNLNAIMLGKTKIRKDGFKHLSHLKNLNHLNLFGFGIGFTDEMARHISQVKSLTSINLGMSDLTNDGLKILTGLHKLSRLDLVATGITDEGAKEFGKFKKLTHLNVGLTKITVNELMKVPEVRNLKILMLGGDNGGITDADLKLLSEIKGLTCLNLLGSDRATSAGLKEIAKLKELRQLRLSNVLIKDKLNKEVGLKEIARNQNLTHLVVEGIETTVTNIDLRSISKLKNLQYLYVESALITDEGLSELGGLENLTNLYLVNTQIPTEADMEIRKRLPKCKVITIAPKTYERFFEVVVNFWFPFGEDYKKFW